MCKDKYPCFTPSSSSCLQKSNILDAIFYYYCLQIFSSNDNTQKMIYGWVIVITYDETVQTQ